MVLEEYWQYFAVGLILYTYARIIWSFYKKRRDNKKTDKKQVHISSQVTEDPDDSATEDIIDDDLPPPALPADLAHVPLAYTRPPTHVTVARARDFSQLCDGRRTVRSFDARRPVPVEAVREAVRAAGTAPSGAHTEPWTFVLVTDVETKRRIREIVEGEEEMNYRQRMGRVWTNDLKALRTNWIKEYLTDAPCLILIFKQIYGFKADGTKKLHYYNEQSASIAAGILLTAIHYAGLCALTTTPLNCGPALRTLLNRPKNEKLTLLIPVGYPAEDCLVPDLKRKPLDEILVEI